MRLNYRQKRYGLVENSLWTDYESMRNDAFKFYKDKIQVRTEKKEDQIGSLNFMLLFIYQVFILLIYH